GAATARSAPSRSSPTATCVPAPTAFPAPEPMDHSFVLDALTSGDWTEMGTIPRASNDTRLLVLEHAGRALKAVYKHIVGQRPLLAAGLCRGLRSRAGRDPEHGQRDPCRSHADLRAAHRGRT